MVDETIKETKSVARLRADGRRSLLVYLDAALIKRLKKSALDLDTNTYEIVEEAVRVGTPSDFKVYDPNLLPRTVERDALGCFAVNLLQKVGDLTVYDRRLSTEVLTTANSIEDALRYGSPLTPCYDAIERIAAWQRSPDRADLWGAGSSLNARLVETARLFLDLRSALPPPSDEPTPVDGDDAEDISGAFSP